MRFIHSLISILSASAVLINAANDCDNNHKGCMDLNNCNDQCSPDNPPSEVSTNNAAESIAVNDQGALENEEVSYICLDVVYLSLVFLFRVCLLILIFLHRWKFMLVRCITRLLSVGNMFHSVFPKILPLLIRSY